MKGDSQGVTDWEAVPSDPDPARDLGYRMLEWDVVRTSNDAEQFIFLPSDDELLRDDAFIVADPDDVCDVSTER